MGGRVLAGLLAAVTLASAAPAWPQRVWPYANEQNAFVSAGQRLSADQVRTMVESRLGPNPIDPTNLWNTGYYFYRNYPRNQDTAQAIKDGFLGAMRRQTDPGRRKVLLQAAIYWEKIHDYGIINVPAGQDNNTRANIYYGDYSKFSTLAPGRAGRPPARSTGLGDWPGRVLNRRQPYQGRADNPYPGAYFPGLYPP
jgi:hypothetical protein